MDPSPLSAVVHFVAGKGGVGKTLVSQALATLFSQRKNTLLIELSEEPAHTPTVTPIIEASIKPNLSYVKIYPDQALYEYLMLKVNSPKIVQALVSHSLLKALIAAMPGLTDLTRLGKIWYHADRPSADGNAPYDAIVVDMPSSGFVRRFLSIATTVHDAVKIGPIAHEAKLMQTFFRNEEKARLHIVCLPQDLVIEETINLIADMKSARETKLGFLLINRVLNFELTSVDQKDYPELYKLVELFKNRIEEEGRQISRLKSAQPHLRTLILHDHSASAPESKIIAAMQEEIVMDAGQ